jgi:phage shock protein A
VNQPQAQAGQISIEDALEAFRKRHSEVADENVLLRAQIGNLERRVAELERQNSLLQGVTQQEESDPEPARSGSYLGEPV